MTLFDSVVVFLGPSLDLEAARLILPDAKYLPPASRGDIEKAVSDGFDTICLIDGVFFEQCSVGHREILGALRQGVKVFGASSMGALRASEMQSFGMVGIGQVYDLYKKNILESDDEVALICDPFSNQPLSEALVNIRATLEKATSGSVLTSEEANLFLEAAAEIYYPERTYDFLIEKIRKGRDVSDSSVTGFEKWIQAGNAADIKKEDAVLLLESIQKLKNMD